MLLMLGICYLHAITMPAQWYHVAVGQVNARLAYLLAFCVPGFLFRGFVHKCGCVGG